MLLEPTILYIIITLIISAIFSGTEIAYISANRFQLALKKEQGSARGVQLDKFYEQPSQFLGTMLVGNNIALVIFGMLMEEAFEEPLQQLLPAALDNDFARLLVLTLISTVIVLIFGEFIPKIMFRLYANKILYAITYPLVVIRLILSPIVLFTVKLSEALLKWILKVKAETTKHIFTRLELEDFIKTVQTKEVDEIDTEMFENALNLPTVKTRNCMVKRGEIEAIDINASISELRQKFVDTRLSRIIVYNRTIDNIVGYVHHLTLLQNPTNIKDIIISIHSLTGNPSVTDLMNRFIKTKTNIAVIKDFQYQTLGIITMEDLLEEIFGEIEDEHDD